MKSKSLFLAFAAVTTLSLCLVIFFTHTTKANPPGRCGGTFVVDGPIWACVGQSSNCTYPCDNPPIGPVIDPEIEF